MFHLHPSRSALSAALAIVVTALAPAHAIERSRASFYNPALSCQLSLPTIATKVTPRAIGYRNAGTAVASVICGLGRPTNDSLLLGGGIYFHSSDDLAHTFNCTGVAGEPGNIRYATKAVTLPAGASWTVSQYTATDFQGAASEIPGGESLSITCSLPPQVAITGLASYYTVEVGTPPP